MSLLQLRKELKELKNSIITQYEPQFKIFVFRVNGLTDAGKQKRILRPMLLHILILMC
jgi:hypothetical protein